MEALRAMFAARIFSYGDCSALDGGGGGSCKKADLISPPEELQPPKQGAVGS
jgi:hypothetical protein